MAFEGEGFGSILIAAACFLAAGATMLWLRGPGSRPHDPPIAVAQVRKFALFLGIIGVGWAVRAAFGPGGFLIASALALGLCGVMLVASRRAT